MRKVGRKRVVLCQGLRRLFLAYSPLTAISGAPCTGDLTVEWQLLAYCTAGKVRARFLEARLPGIGD